MQLYLEFIPTLVTPLTSIMPTLRCVKQTVATVDPDPRVPQESHIAGSLLKSNTRLKVGI